ASLEGGLPLHVRRTSVSLYRPVRGPGQPGRGRGGGFGIAGDPVLRPAARHRQGYGGRGRPIAPHPLQDQGLPAHAPGQRAPRGEGPRHRRGRDEDHRHGGPPATGQPPDRTRHGPGRGAPRSSPYLADPGAHTPPGRNPGRPCLFLHRPSPLRCRLGPPCPQNGARASKGYHAQKFPTYTRAAAADPPHTRETARPSADRGLGARSTSAAAPPPGRGPSHVTYTLAPGGGAAPTAHGGRVPPRGEASHA